MGVGQWRTLATIAGVKWTGTDATGRRAVPDGGDGMDRLAYYPRA
jgi:hypothetical protein